jgi:hypothetical protein
LGTPPFAKTATRQKNLMPDLSCDLVAAGVSIGTLAL